MQTPNHFLTLRVVKAVHTAIWFTVEAAVMYLVYAGIANKRGPLFTASAGAVIGETVVYLANGARCPLTDVAEQLGADSGSVTDIYLPRWVAKSLPAIHVPLIALIVWLHVRQRRVQI